MDVREETPADWQGCLRQLTAVKALGGAAAALALALGFRNGAGPRENLLACLAALFALAVERLGEGALYWRTYGPEGGSPDALPSQASFWEYMALKAAQGHQRRQNAWLTAAVLTALGTFAAQIYRAEGSYNLESWQYRRWVATLLLGTALAAAIGTGAVLLASRLRNFRGGWAENALRFCLMLPVAAVLGLALRAGYRILDELPTEQAQPDGRVLLVQIRGNTLETWYATPDGLILRNDAAGPRRLFDLLEGTKTFDSQDAVENAPSENGPQSDPVIYGESGSDGFDVLYRTVFAGEGYTAAYSTTAKGETKMTLTGPAGEQRSVLYNRSSPDGSWEEYVVYSDADGGADSTIDNFYAVNAADGAVICGEKQSWEASDVAAYNDAMNS